MFVYRSVSGEEKKFKTLKEAAKFMFWSLIRPKGRFFFAMIF